MKRTALRLVEAAAAAIDNDGNPTTLCFIYLQRAEINGTGYLTESKMTQIVVHCHRQAKPRTNPNPRPSATVVIGCSLNKSSTGSIALSATSMIGPGLSLPSADAILSKSARTRLTRLLVSFLDWSSGEFPSFATSSDSSARSCSRIAKPFWLQLPWHFLLAPAGLASAE